LKKVSKYTKKNIQLLNRAQRVVECAFGILTSKWRILRKLIDTSVNTISIVRAMVCSYNFL